MTALREKMLADMQLRGYSLRTQQAYVRSIEKFARHYNRSPEQLSTDEIRAYLLHLISSPHISDSYVRIIYSAIRFLYETTLDQQWDMKKLPRTKTPKRLPVLLSASELIELFQASTHPKQRAILMTLYGAGLRASEVANLRISDIDSKNMSIRVQQGKGRKDRYTLLSETNLEVLRWYWRVSRPSVWLFPDTPLNGPISARTVGHMFRQAKRRAGITKSVSAHTLRHCFATHLLEQGATLAHIQQLLGHANLRTTSIYVHLTRKDVLNVCSPLDKLGWSL